MKRPYNLIVRQLGGIGDNIMLSCLFRGLREKYPNRQNVLVTHVGYLCGALKILAEHNPFIDEIVDIAPYEKTDILTSQRWPQYYRDAPRIENDPICQRAEEVFYMNTPCVGYEWPALETPEGITKPRYQVWCEAAGIVPSTYKPIYELQDSERKKALTYLVTQGLHNLPLVGVGVTAAHDKRAAGVNKIHSICTQLFAKGLQPVTIDPTFKFDDVPGIVGKNIADLMGLISHMVAFVSADTGTLHMAGALDVPVVGLFGPTDPDMRMKPYRGSAVKASSYMACAPCWYKWPCTHDPNQQKHLLCMNQIPVSKVVDEVLYWGNLTNNTVNKL